MKEKNFRKISNIFIIVMSIHMIFVMIFYVSEFVGSFELLSSTSFIFGISKCLYNIGFIIFVKTQLTNKYENTGLKIFFIIAILRPITFLVYIIDQQIFDIDVIVTLIYDLTVDILLFLNVIKRKNKILPYVLIIFCVIIEAEFIIDIYNGFIATHYNFKILEYFHDYDGIKNAIIYVIMINIIQLTYFFVLLYQTLYIFYYNRDNKEKIKKSTIISTIILVLALIFYIFISLNVPKLVLSSMVNQITKIDSTNFEGNTVKGQLIVGSHSKYNKKKANYNVSTAFFKSDSFADLSEEQEYYLREDFLVYLKLTTEFEDISNMSKYKSFVVNDRTFYIDHTYISKTILEGLETRISVVTDLGNGLYYNIDIEFDGTLSKKDIMYLRPFFEVTV